MSTEMQVVDDAGVLISLNGSSIETVIENIITGHASLIGKNDEILADGLELAKKGMDLALPFLLHVIWTESRIEDTSKARQAQALFALRESSAWHPYADTISKGETQVPSWRSFVGKYLPMSYATCTARTNVISTFVNKLEWPIEKIAEIGMGKLQTARHAVEEQIEETGEIEPEMERILTEETHENLMHHLAGTSNPDKIGFSFNTADGTLWVHFPESICEGVAMAQIGQFEFHYPEGVSAQVWQDSIYKAVSALKATIEV